MRVFGSHPDVVRWLHAVFRRLGSSFPVHPVPVDVDGDSGAVVTYVRGRLQPVRDALFSQHADDTVHCVAVSGPVRFIVDAAVVVVVVVSVSTLAGPGVPDDPEVRLGWYLEAAHHAFLAWRFHGVRWPVLGVANDDGGASLRLRMHAVAILVAMIEYGFSGVVVTVETDDQWAVTEDVFSTIGSGCFHVPVVLLRQPPLSVAVGMARSGHVDAVGVLNDTRTAWSGSLDGPAAPHDRRVDRSLYTDRERWIGV